MISSVAQSISIVKPIAGRVDRRVFLTFDPVINSYCTLNTPLDMSVDFEIEVEFYVQSDIAAETTFGLLGSAGENILYVRWVGSVLRFYWQCPGTGGNTWFSVIVSADAIQKVLVKKVGTDFTLKNIITDTSSTITKADYNGENISSIGRWKSGNGHFDGIISSIKYTDISTPANNQKYAIDRAAGTIEHSQVGSSYITYNNLPDANREIYKRESANDLWVGSKELLTNPGFDADTDWGKYTGWTISGGAAHFYNETEYSRLLYQTMTRPSSYRVQAEISAMANNNLQFYNGASYTTTLTTIGNHRFDVDNGNLAHATFIMRANQPTLGGAIELDRVSMKRILRIA